MAVAALSFVILSCIGAVFVPWIGVIAYYALALGQLEGLWPEAFGRGRYSLLVTAFTVLGVMLATVAGKVDMRRLYQPQSLLVLLLVIWVNLSAEYSGFVTSLERVADFTPEFVLSTFNKVILFYFIAILVIDDKQKLLYLCYFLAALTLYYTYWGNKIYLTGEFWRFGDNARLNGPDGNYQDENYLGMVYVFGTPVLYYLGISMKNQVIRYGLWLAIPLSWHGLFLTGSRGGLVALSVVCVYIFFRSYNKAASVILIVGFLAAIVFQSGNLLTRVDDTLDRAESTQEEALDPRLISWGVGLKMIRDHPIFGVGVGNFQNAFPSYSHTKTHVAHNTFFEFASNCGLITGIIYLYFFFKRFRNFRSKYKLEKEEDKNPEKNYIDDMINSLFLGFFVIAIFLDLMIYEFMYYFLLMAFTKNLIDNPIKGSEKNVAMKKSIYLSEKTDSVYG